MKLKSNATVQSFWLALEKKFLPDYAWSSNPLTFWRERILFAIAFVTAVFGPLALIPSLIFAFHEKFFSVMIIDTAAYLVMTSILFLKKFPLKFRGAIACFDFFALGAAISYILGPVGAGYIWLFGASVMASIMIGTLGSFWMMFLNAAALCAIAVLISMGSPPWIAEMVNPLQKWMVLTINFLLFNALVSITTSFMLSGLKRALITEQTISANLRQSEERYRSSHERFLTVLNSLEAHIYVVDMETCEILFMNKRMIENYKNDFTGGICWSHLKGRSGPCSRCAISRMEVEGDDSAGVNIWEENNTLTQKWYINHDRVIKWTDGRKAKIQIATDITEFKKMEKELRQSQKMEAIGTLAGGIAHDFNNILSSIIGFAELTLEDVDKGTMMEDNLKEVLVASSRAKDLVKQILAFARQSDQEVKPIQIKTIVKEVLKLIRPATPASIEIRQNINSDALIMGNPTEIHQIVMNLCSNAAYAMAGCTGVLSISLEDEEVAARQRLLNSILEPGSYLRLTVSDTGTGIAPEHINTVFEPYFTTKPKGEGTGIGLAMVHGIVESYGGNITVESTLGKGTRFDIYLPVIKRHLQGENQQSEDVCLGNERILFVDDELPIVKMAGRALQRLGYQVTMRTSSIEALELFQAKPDNFDLIITDYTMPNMTGDTLAVEALRIRKEIPIIICTGYSKDITAEKIKTMGVKAFVHKPIVQAKLTQTIRSVLASSQDASGDVIISDPAD